MSAHGADAGAAPASTARYVFTTQNYSISTFPPWEWFFVYDPDKGRAEVQLSSVLLSTRNYKGRTEVQLSARAT